MTPVSSKRLNLALQGGGSHGAFTWGVLHRLLDEDRLAFDSLAGVSSGAMNATMLASGYINGGRDGAKQTLSSFWDLVSTKYNELFAPAPTDIWKKVVGIDYPGPLDAYLSLTHSFSPYQLNPFNLNPLRDILHSVVDFEGLQNSEDLQLHIGATQVRTGKMRVFRNSEITADVLLASACLPSMNHAIEIDGEPYWDGGFSGNPPLFPLIFDSHCADILIILLQPLIRESLPTTADEIRKRSNELSFTTAFLREMRAIALSKDKIKANWMRSGDLEKRMNKLNIHMIEDASLETMNATSRYHAGADVMQDLFSRGWTTADSWLSEHFGSVNRRSSVNLLELFT